MDATAGGRGDAGYREPRIIDYGTLAQLTGDGAPLLMRQLGVGAAQVTAPATPGDGGGGGGGGGDVGGIVAPGTPEAPVESAVGGEVEAPAGGEGAEAAEPGESGAQGETAEPGAGAGQVAGADELPFTGLNVAATAAVGAATTAAGVALRKALNDEPAG